MTDAAIRAQTAYLRQLVETVERASTRRHPPKFQIVPMREPEPIYWPRYYSAGLGFGVSIVCVSLAIALVHP